VHQMPVGHRPNRVAGRIFRSLAEHVDQTGRGNAYTDSMGFAVAELISGRQSFSPDAAYYFGPLPANPMRFVEGPPTFAVEVRSEGDYGQAAEAELAAKRADYVEAGTLIVWDVDPIAETIRVYRADAPGVFELYQRGQEVDAEPVVPGWRVAVDWIFA
jgi:Uma2 family endonuclease